MVINLLTKLRLHGEYVWKSLTLVHHELYHKTVRQEMAGMVPCFRRSLADFVSPGTTQRLTRNISQWPGSKHNHPPQKGAIT